MLNWLASSSGESHLLNPRIGRGLLTLPELLRKIAHLVQVRSAGSDRRVNTWVFCTRLARLRLLLEPDSGTTNDVVMEGEVRN